MTVGQMTDAISCLLRRASSNSYEDRLDEDAVLNACRQT